MKNPRKVSAKNKHMAGKIAGASNIPPSSGMEQITVGQEGKTIKNQWWFKYSTGGCKLNGTKDSNYRDRGKQTGTKKGAISEQLNKIT